MKEPDNNKIMTNAGKLFVGKFRKMLLNHSLISKLIGGATECTFILALHGGGINGFTCTTVDELIAEIGYKVTPTNSYWIGFKVNEYLISVCDLHYGNVRRHKTDRMTEIKPDGSRNSIINCKDVIRKIKLKEFLS